MVDETGRGRPAQRRRTRKAIVDAAARLMAAGRRPSMAEIAENAEVSRRTVYMYFPTLEQLLLDAALGTVAERPIEAALQQAEACSSESERVGAIARALQRMAGATEQEGRTLVRLTAEPREPDETAPSPRRGYRRIEWIERALAPLRSRLTRAEYRRLMGALAMVVGWEALIVQRDICGLSVEQSADLSAWAARALVEEAVRESRRSRRSRQTRGSDSHR